MSGRQSLAEDGNALTAQVLEPSRTPARDEQDRLAGAGHLRAAAMRPVDVGGDETQTGDTLFGADEAAEPGDDIQRRDQAVGWNRRGGARVGGGCPDGG